MHTLQFLPSSYTILGSIEFGCKLFDDISPFILRLISLRCGWLENLPLLAIITEKKHSTFL